MGVDLPEDVLNFLANRIRTNIRRLEGALIRVASYASLTGKKLTIEVVEGLLREILHEEGRFTINIEVIQKKVAEHFDIRLADMTSKRRPENIAFPRQIAMYLSRQMTESSLNTIGEAFGGRDHGTVLHACRLVKDRMEVDANVRQVVHYLEKQLMRCKRLQISRCSVFELETEHLQPRNCCHASHRSQRSDQGIPHLQKAAGISRARSAAFFIGNTNRPSPSTTSVSTLSPANWSAFSARTARAKPPRSRCFPACFIPRAARRKCSATRRGNAHDGYRRQFALLLGQKNQLWWDLPARESLELNAKIYGIPQDRFERTVGEMTELLAVKDKLNVIVRELSLGERMKMELIASLLHQPKVLFLDEPTIGLDVVSQKTVREFLRRLQCRRRRPRSC